MSRFGAVLVGCGQIADAWVQSALDHDDLELVAIVDADIDRARALTARYAFNTATFSTLDDAIRTTGPNLVLDITPPGFHPTTTVTAVKAGCDVLGEKPIATTADEAVRVIGQVVQSGQRYSVMQNRRYGPPVRALAELVRAGSLGGVGLISADFFFTGPDEGFRVTEPHQLLLDMGVHTLDQARLIAGGEGVWAECVEFNPPGSWFTGNAGALATVAFDNGAMISYRGTWAAAGFHTGYDCTWRIAGTDGSAIWDGWGDPITEIAAPGPGPRLGRSVTRTELDTSAYSIAEPPDPMPSGKWRDTDVLDIRPYFRGHAACLAEMLQALRDDRPAETDCRENFKSAALVFAAMESAETGRRVAIPALPITATVGTGGEY